MGYVGNQTSNSYTSLAKQTITGDGGASYTLDHAVANEQEIEVFVNNVRQEPSVAYTVSGTALTMTGNVAASDDFYVVFQGKALQTVTPPDLSVTTAKIVDANVTTVKINDDAITSAKIADDAVKFAHINEDFYKTGTWTPTLTTTSTDFSSVTYATPTTYGYYTCVGDDVFIYGRMRTSAVTIGSASGSVTIGGLPFNVVSHYGVGMVGYTTGWSGYAPSVMIMPQGAAKRIDLYRHASTNASSSQGTGLAVSNVSTSTNDIIFSGMYRKA